MVLKFRRPWYTEVRRAWYWRSGGHDTGGQEGMVLGGRRAQCTEVRLHRGQEVIVLRVRRA